MLSSVDISLSLAVLAAASLASLSAQAQTAKASLKDASGKDVGQVALLQTPHGVLLKLSVKGVPAGEHAFHVHAVGKCEPPFTSAGGHLQSSGGARSMAWRRPRGRMLATCPTCSSRRAGELTVEIANLHDLAILPEASPTRCSMPTVRP